MVVINAAVTAIAVLVVLLIFLRLERREMRTAWGDLRRGVWMALTRAGLLRLRDEPEDPRALGGGPLRWR